MLKWFLLTMPISLVVFAVSALLHNVVSGLLRTEEPVFFIIAVILAPAAFVIGALGSLFLGVRRLVAGA